MTARTGFPNLAPVPRCDSTVTAELISAGIPVNNLPEFMRKKTGSREVDTVVVGLHLGWAFERAWTYWVASGNGIPYDLAKELNDRLGHDVRIDGHGCGKSPEEFNGFGIGSYHIDTAEGLLALRETLDKVYDRFKAQQSA